MTHRCTVHRQSARRGAVLGYDEYPIQLKSLKQQIGHVSLPTLEAVLAIVWSSEIGIRLHSM